jgi:hypothetical protein
MFNGWIDIPASDIAVLSGLTTSAQTIQLSAGGDAVLTSDFLLHRVFHVHVGGRVHIVNNPGQAVTVALLLNGTQIASVVPSGNGTTSPFYLDLTCFYEDNTSTLFVQGSNNTLNYSGGGTPSFSNNTGTVGDYFKPFSSVAQFQFKVTVESNATDSGSATLTEFRVLAT